jgi:hypothetical protein
MPTRFVILHHRQGDGEHWDLMIERGDVLETWQLARNPLTPGPWPIPARRIGDHRKAYLEYEGPVSRNRGHVSRIDAGFVNRIDRTPTCYALQFTGAKLSGEFTLADTPDGQWTLDRRQGSRMPL